MKRFKLKKGSDTVEINEDGKVLIDGKEYEAKVNFDIGKIEIIGICQESAEAIIIPKSFSLIGKNNQMFSSSECEAPKKTSYGEYTYDDVSCPTCTTGAINNDAISVKVKKSFTNEDGEIDKDVIYDAIVAAGFIYAHHITKKSNVSFSVIDTANDEVILYVTNNLFSFRTTDFYMLSLLSTIFANVVKELELQKYELLFVKNAPYIASNKELVLNASRLNYFATTENELLSFLDFTRASNAMNISIQDESEDKRLQTFTIFYNENTSSSSININFTKCNRVLYEDVLKVLETLDGSNLSGVVGDNEESLLRNEVETHYEFERIAYTNPIAKNFNFTSGRVPRKLNDKFSIFGDGVDEMEFSIPPEERNCFDKFPIDTGSIKKLNQYYMNDDLSIGLDEVDAMEDAYSLLASGVTSLPTYKTFSFNYPYVFFPSFFIKDIVTNYPQVTSFTDGDIKYTRGLLLEQTSSLTGDYKNIKDIGIFDVETIDLRGDFRNVVFNQSVKNLYGVTTKIDDLNYKNVFSKENYPTGLDSIETYKGNDITGSFYEKYYPNKDTNHRTGLKIGALLDELFGQNTSNFPKTMPDFEIDYQAIEKYKIGLREVDKTFVDAVVEVVEFFKGCNNKYQFTGSPFTELKGDFVSAGDGGLDTSIYNVLAGGVQLVEVKNIRPINEVQRDITGVYREGFRLSNSGDYTPIYGTYNGTGFDDGVQFDIEAWGKIGVVFEDGAFIAKLPIDYFKTPKNVYIDSTIDDNGIWHHEIVSKEDYFIEPAPTQIERADEFVQYYLTEEDGAITITWVNNSSFSPRYFTINDNKVEIPTGGE